MPHFIPLDPDLATILPMPHDAQELALGIYTYLVPIDPPPPIPLFWSLFRERRSPEAIAEARIQLLSGDWPEDGTLPQAAREVDSAAHLTSQAYAAKSGEERDQVYVLEFQGPRAQYIKFGHTAAFKKRVTNLRTEANRHGFALLNCWASPGTTLAKSIEQRILTYARSFEHSRVSANEYFFGMPYGIARDLARAVYTEIMTGPNILD